MKRLFSALLTLVLFLSMLPVSLPAKALCTDQLIYEISDGQVTITGHVDGQTEAWSIPDTIDGYPVTAIGKEAFYYCKSMTSIRIPDSVTHIGRAAFAGCISLEGLTIPNGVAVIEDNAFYGCENLTEIIIPESVTRLGVAIFAECPKLTGICVVQDNPAYKTDCFGVIYSKDGTVLLAAPVSISGHYTIPDGVKIIGNSAFFYCQGLTGLTVPNGVTDIGPDAFYYCENLTDLALPDSVTAIGISSFTGCNKLQYQMYDGCKYYGTETVPYRWLLRATDQDRTEITIHPQTKIIGRNAFLMCDALTGVTIPEGVEVIERGAFMGCTALLSMTVPESVKRIGASAFESCGFQRIYFAGDAPSCQDTMFAHVDTTVYYHKGAAGWEDVTFSNNSGSVTLEEVEHICPTYTYDENHTCTEDGTERAVCLYCGETDIRKAEGTAAHRYRNGVCVQCGRTASEEQTALLTGLFPCYRGVNAQLTLTAVEESQPTAIFVVTPEQYISRYTMESLTAGDYILTAAKDGYVTRTYAVTLVPGENRLDVELHCSGDLDGDGKISVDDVAGLYAHVKGTVPLNDDYLKLCADLSGDGRISLGDVSRLLAMARSS